MNYEKRIMYIYTVLWNILKFRMFFNCSFTIFSPHDDVSLTGILPRITFLDTNTTRTCGFIDFANESGVLNDWINEDRSIEIHVSIQLHS